ncbi:MAG: hypothetical protein HRT94_00010 [Alphaproteobacteria bacterium]|nr:hypothetical protein [Alphaproteobacteria bacterium]
MIKKTILFAFLAAIAACSQINYEVSKHTATRMARPAFMVERYIPTEHFKLYVWERMHKRNAPASIYIGDDIDGWAYKDLVASNALFESTSPANPVALHLSTRDKSDNVAYLSRPCEFLVGKELEQCPEKYRTGERYSADVIDSYHNALDEMKARYDLSSFNLIGHGGGGQIAAYIATERTDVVSLRTVAGNLNHEFIATERQSKPIQGSLNAVNIASRLAHIPQHHFVGGADDIVTPGVYHSFRQAMGPSSCVHYSLVQDAGHNRGWVEKWPDLLAIEPKCSFKEAEFTPDSEAPMFEPYIPSRDYIPVSK